MRNQSVSSASWTLNLAFLKPKCYPVRQRHTNGQSANGFFDVNQEVSDQRICKQDYKSDQTINASFQYLAAFNI